MTSTLSTSHDEFSADVVLPSKGLLYEDDFCPGGEVTITMMGTMEEKLLAGSRTSAGKLISTLLERLIVTPKINPGKLLAFDRMYLLVNIRVLTFGADYRFSHRCPHCETNSEYLVDLADIPVNKLDDDFEEPIETVLPLSGKKVKLRFPRGEDEEAIQRDVKKKGSANLNDGDPTYIPTLARLIHSVGDDEITDYPSKLKFVQNLKSKDSVYIQRFMENLNYGPDLKTFLTCNSCGGEIETSIPFSEEFFRPKL